MVSAPKLPPFITGLKPTPRVMAGGAAIIALIIGLLSTGMPHPDSLIHHSVTVAVPSQKITLALPPKPADKPAPEAPATPNAAPAPEQPQPTVQEEQPQPPVSGDITNNVLKPSSAPASLLKRLVDAQQSTQKLAAAPIRDLTVGTPDGLMPRIAADGRQAWFAYARPVPALPAVPRIAIMVIDAGLSARLTRPALEQLPGQVTVAFNAFSPNLENQIDGARSNGINGGHEVVLDIPAEPMGYPEEDPGPDALLTRLTAEQNLKRLRPFLVRAPGAIGIISSAGGRFTNDGDALSPILQEMNLRGMAYIDVTHRHAGTETPTISSLVAKPIGTVTADAETWADDILSPSKIREQLAAALDTARKNGSALIIARPYPLSVGLLNEFINALPQQGVALVPVSAIIKKTDR